MTFYQSVRKFWWGWGVILGVLMTGPGWAQMMLTYKTYDPRTEQEFNRFTLQIPLRMDEGEEVRWVMREGPVTINETYVLDAQAQTLNWSVKNATAHTDYIGVRLGDRLHLRGQFQGQPLDRELLIDQRPFYYNPKLGLGAFVRSGKKVGHFWGFRQDVLEVYPMKAIRKRVETINVNGQQVSAVRVHWTVDDWRSTFFKRVYWFRPSDGLYLKQKVDGGAYRELVGSN